MGSSALWAPQMKEWKWCEPRTSRHSLVWWIHATSWPSRYWALASSSSTLRGTTIRWNIKSHLQEEWVNSQGSWQQFHFPLTWESTCIKHLGTLMVSTGMRLKYKTWMNSGRGINSSLVSLLTTRGSSIVQLMTKLWYRHAMVRSWALVKLIRWRPPWTVSKGTRIDLTSSCSATSRRRRVKNELQWNAWLIQLEFDRTKSCTWSFTYHRKTIIGSTRLQALQPATDDISLDILSLLIPATSKVTQMSTRQTSESMCSGTGLTVSFRSALLEQPMSAQSSFTLMKTYILTLGVNSQCNLPIRTMLLYLK